MVKDYEVQIKERMTGWSVVHRNSKGQIVDAFFSRREDAEGYAKSLKESPRGYYH